ncbi:MAG: hypothetical protein U0M15_01165 [Bacillota bacterium]|nr:hypothetical protein [Bacillota bacterium]
MHGNGVLPTVIGRCSGAPLASLPSCTVTARCWRKLLFPLHRISYTL